jgi:prepilin-type N-terminal cleavage/methylation domain-containing protein
LGTLISSVKRKAFTLIELAIILAIIGVMSAVAITQMMDLTGSAEEALFEDYLQKLNTGVAQYMVAKGHRPDSFSDFVGATLDVSNGVTVPLLVSKSGDPICPAPGAGTMNCNGAGVRSRNATFTLTSGTIELQITRLGGNGTDNP